MGLFAGTALAGVSLTETDRIMSLSRRLPGQVDRRPWADSTFRLPGATMSTRAVQAEALWEIATYGGFFGPIAIGWGKTLICFLAPRALGVTRAVLMLPAPLVRSWENEREKYIQGGFDPGACSLTVLPYHHLSDPRCSALLEELAPEAIIADEAHNLRNFTAARTRRFLRYMDAHPECAFVCMSGTMFGTSVRDGAHLAWLALRQHSPLPRPDSSHIRLWGNVLDEGAVPTATETHFFHESVTCPLLDEDERGGSMRSAARRAVHKRIVETAGVISTTEPSCTVPLRIEQEPLRAPLDVEAAAEFASGSWELPTGETLDSPAHASAAARYLSAGFYYSWDWDAVGGRDEAWMRARATWSRLLRTELAERSMEHYDSPALVIRKIEDDIAKDPMIVRRKELHWAWSEWSRHLARLPTVPVRTTWVSSFLLDDVDKYRNTNTIVWYSSSAVEDALRARGWEVRGAGDGEITGAARPIAASISVHGTGKNLQAWSRAVVVEPPASGVAWEQLLGRLHRPGQGASEVVFSIYATTTCTRDALTTARRKAAFIQDVQGQQQRLLEHL